MRSEEWAARVEAQAAGSDVRDEFNYMLEQAKINGWEIKIPCHGRAREFMDMRSPKSQEEAQALCEGCPLLQLHRQEAEIFRPPWGVAGGVSWVDGKPFEGRRQTLRSVAA